MCLSDDCGIGTLFAIMLLFIVSSVFQAGSGAAVAAGVGAVTATATGGKVRARKAVWSGAGIGAAVGLVADSAALTLFNNGELKERDFIHRSGAAALTPDGRRTVIRAFERRLDTLIRHPLFSYSVSYRRIMELQARLLGRHLLGELPSYPAFTTR